jgi:hypothetical protein
MVRYLSGKLEDQPDLVAVGDNADMDRWLTLLVAAAWKP